MIWTLIFYIILIFCVIVLCSKAFKYVPLSKFHHFYVPIYSIVLFLITFPWTNKKEWLILLVLLPISLLIGWYQTSQIETKKEFSEKKHRFHYLVKRNRAYVIGWILLLAIGIALGELNAKTSVVSAFSERIFAEIASEFDPLLIFSEHHPWYIWFMSGVSTLTFAYCSTRKIKKEEQGL